MRRPDAVYAAMADPIGLDHHPAGPLRDLAGRFGLRHCDCSLDHRGRQHRFTGGSGGFVRQAANPFGHKPRLPAPNRRLAFAGLPLIAIVPTPAALSSTIRTPPTHASAGFPRSDHGLQPLSIARSKPDLDNPFSSRQTRIFANRLESFLSADPLTCPSFQVAGK
jgi:hypothetical protein